MRHVLSVEDNPMNQMTIKDIFRYDDVPGELVCVDNAEEALRILPLLDPLVILMDLMLPGMSGVEATRIIKSDPVTQHIQVWAVTACTTRAEIDEALAAGCDGYFTKPVRAKKLVEQLRVFEEEEFHSLQCQTAGAIQ